ncbi:MAG: hypothetical protein ACXWNK_06730 [Vulcanimicrobiaceae bacterium]
MRIISIDLPTPSGHESYGARDIPEGSRVLNAYATNDRLFVHVLGDPQAPLTKLRYWIVPVGCEIGQLGDVQHAGMVLLGHDGVKRPYHVFTRNVEP